MAPCQRLDTLQVLIPHWYGRDRPMPHMACDGNWVLLNLSWVGGNLGAGLCVRPWAGNGSASKLR